MTETTWPLRSARHWKSGARVCAISCSRRPRMLCRLPRVTLLRRWGGDVMLSATSFTDDLERYQIADPRCQQIIDSWREFAGTNEMWRKIQKVAARHCRPPVSY